MRYAFSSRKKVLDTASLRRSSQLIGGFSSSSRRRQFSGKADTSASITPIQEFDFLSAVETGTHEVWKAKHIPTERMFYVKCPAITKEEVIGFQERGSSIDLTEIVNPMQVRFDAEREILGSRLVRLFLGKEGHSPEDIFLVKAEEGDWRRFWIASQEVPGFIGMDQVGKTGGEKFFVNSKGKTCLWLNDKESVETTGRIRTKFALLAAGEGDENEENVGISGEGPQRKIASIDHGQCLRKFPYVHLSPSDLGEVLASGESGSPIPAIDLRSVQNILRREEVRKESIRHIADCFRDGQEIRSLFMEGFSWDYPVMYKEQMRQIGKQLHHTGAGFIFANILLQHEWDKTPEMARVILSDPRNTKEIKDYMEVMRENQGRAA